MTRRLILMVALIVGLAAPAEAGFDEGEAALRELKPLAEQGDAIAQFNLGILYSKGWGVARDASATAI